MTDTAQSVTRVVPVAADRVFAVLTDPPRHAEIDGSGMIRAVVSTGRLSKVGDVFRVDMNQPGFGDYQTDNRVVQFEDGRKIAWATGSAGGAALGHVWTWELAADGDSTTITHTYDWSAVTDERVLSMVSFPVVSPEQMATSIQNLADAAS